MFSLEDEKTLLAQLMNLLSIHFGENCEVVLHDLTKDYQHTIVDIRNGHVTGRVVGGCGSNLGLEVLNGSVMDGDRYNYVTTNPDGRILRSSSIYLKNPNNEIIGSLCVNVDISESVRLESFLRKCNHIENMTDEFFAHDVASLLDYLIEQAQTLVGKNLKAMNKEERVRFLQFLDQKGAFQISKSSIKICELLGVSKFTLYNDLENIRKARSER